MQVKKVVRFSKAELRAILMKHLGISEAFYEPISEEKEVNHHARVEGIFTYWDVVDRETLVTGIKKWYECGTNKVTNAGGILSQLMDLNLIFKEGRSHFRINRKAVNSESIQIQSKKKNTEELPEIDLHFELEEDESASFICLEMPDSIKLKI